MPIRVRREVLFAEEALSSEQSPFSCRAIVVDQAHLGARDMPTT
jgi:hypothetical protein